MSLRVLRSPERRQLPPLCRSLTIRHRVGNTEMGAFWNWLSASPPAMSGQTLARQTAQGCGEHRAFAGGRRADNCCALWREVAEATPRDSVCGQRHRTSFAALTTSHLSPLAPPTGHAAALPLASARLPIPFCPLR